MGQLIDLTGKRFGRLIVIKRNESNEKEALWICQCDCGKEILTRGSSLRSGVSSSCGCKRQEYWEQQHNKQTHGGSRERLYRVWRGMIDRCYYPSHNRYTEYGGRGIKICDEWRHDYNSFRQWALANGYDETASRGICTIDRINVDDSYSPSNCRWVSMKIQAKNKQKKGKI